MLALVAVGAMKLWGADLKGGFPAALGLLAGVFISAMSEALGRPAAQSAAGRAAPIAIGAAACALTGLLVAPDLEPAQIGLGFGMAAGAWMLGVGGDGWPAKAAAMANAAILVNVLGRRGPGELAGYSGATLAVATGIVAVCILAGWPKPKEGERRLGVSTIVFAAVTIGAAWLVGAKLLAVEQAWLVFSIGSAIGLAAIWLLPEEGEHRALPFSIATIIWLGGATLAFGMLKGFGMSLLLLGGVSVALFASNGRAMLTLGPLAALVAYRVFREMHTGASRALDIGQHYGLIGVLVGAMLLVAAWEWRASKPASARGDWASALWVVALGGSAVLAGVVLGAKGFVGVLAGLGLGAAVIGLAAGHGAMPFAIAAGLGSAMSLGFGWISKLLDLTREEKTTALYWSAPALLAASLAIAFLSKPKAATDAARGESA